MWCNLRHIRSLYQAYWTIFNGWHTVFYFPQCLDSVNRAAVRALSLSNCAPLTPKYFSFQKQAQPGLTPESADEINKESISSNLCYFTEAKSLIIKWSYAVWLKSDNWIENCKYTGLWVEVGTASCSVFFPSSCHPCAPINAGTNDKTTS